MDESQLKRINCQIFFFLKTVYKRGETRNNENLVEHFSDAFSEGVVKTAPSDNLPQWPLLVVLIEKLGVRTLIKGNCRRQSEVKVISSSIQLNPLFSQMISRPRGCTR